MATPPGAAPVAKSTFATNEPVVIELVVLVFLKTETVFGLLLVTAKSSFPSPSISAIATACGFAAAVKSTFAAKEPVVIDPAVLKFLKTEIVLLVLLGTTKSGFPSPSTSPKTTLYGADPDAKSTFAANEPIVIDPDVLVFLKTEIVLLVVLGTIKSSFPSPSTSPIATSCGTVPVAK